QSLKDGISRSHPVSRSAREAAGVPRGLACLDTNAGAASPDPARLMWPREGAALRFDVRAAGATVQVIVDEAHRLHEGVDCGWSDERPAAPPEVLRQCRGLRRCRQDAATLDALRPRF